MTWDSKLAYRVTERGTRVECRALSGPPVRGTVLGADGPGPTDLVCIEFDDQRYNARSGNPPHRTIYVAALVNCLVGEV